MAIAKNLGSTRAEPEIHIREIGLRDLQIALEQGWEDFLDRRGDIFLLGVIYPIAVIFAIFFAFRISILPIIFPLFAGSALLGPVAATGYYEIARRREFHLDTRWRHFFDVLIGQSGFSIVGLAVVLFLVFSVWVLAAWIIYKTTIGTLPPETVRTPGEFIMAVLTSPEGLNMLIVGNPVGLVFAVLALCMSVVSFPMLVDKPVRWSTAMRTSFRVARKNPVTVLAWGFIVVTLLVLGAIPAFIGLAVVLPVLGYSTWHLYTRAVER